MDLCAPLPPIESPVDSNIFLSLFHKEQNRIMSGKKMENKEIFLSNKYLLPFSLVGWICFHFHSIFTHPTYKFVLSQDVYFSVFLTNIQMSIILVTFFCSRSFLSFWEQKIQFFTSAVLLKTCQGQIWVSLPYISHTNLNFNRFQCLSIISIFLFYSRMFCFCIDLGRDDYNNYL